MSSDFDFYEPEPPSSGTPIVPGGKPKPAETLSWYETWRMAILRPGEETARRIANDPNASARTAYLWVLASTIFTLPVSLLQLSLLPEALNQPEIRELFPAEMTGQILTISMWAIPIGVLLSVPLFMLSMTITHWASRQFGGMGSYERLAYANAAFSAPLQIVAAVIGLVALFLTTSGGIDLSQIGTLIGLYSFVLYAISIKAIHELTWGRTIGSILILMVIMVALTFMVFCAFAALFGPQLQEWAQSMPSNSAFPR
ncbi:MAG: YIP1 family protein [Burkholderiales bacterium]|nr:YIP1 family protein [Anaerolineae bacterium]